MINVELLRTDNSAPSLSLNSSARNKSFGKVGWATALILATLALSGCVESKEPLLTDGQPLVGQQFEVHLYEDFQDDKAGDFHASAYRWDDGRYVRASGLVRDETNFVVKQLSGDDFIIQGSAGADKVFNYWIGRRVVPGVYLIVPVNEDDVDAAVRANVCAKDQPEGICKVETYDHLVTLALATASKPVRNPALSVILPHR